MYPNLYWADRQDDLNNLDLDSDSDYLAIYLSGMGDRARLGRWIGLPADEDELRKAYNIVSNNGDFDHDLPDYEGPLRDLARQTSDIFRLNEFCEQVERKKLDEEDVVKIAWLIRDLSLGDFEDVFECDEYDGTLVFNEEKDVKNYIVEGFIEAWGIPEGVQRYLDEELIVRDADHYTWEQFQDYWIIRPNY